MPPKKKLDRFQLVREMARERIGQPRPSSILTDKRAKISRREEERERRERSSE